MRKEIKFPTIIGLILLVISLIVGVYLSQTPISFRSKASGDCQPVNLQITNQTHHSADVFFLSTSDCSSALEINGQILADISSTDLGKIHYFQINNLEENREINFKIIANGNTYEDKSYLIKTATQPKASTPTSNLAWGRVFNPDSTPAVNAIVYLVIPGAMPLSSVVTSNGNWNISLANSFNDQKNDWFIPPVDTPEDIFVLSSDGQITQIAHNTSSNNPVPDITIGQNFFSSPSSGTSGILENISAPEVNFKLSINNPQEGETINTDTPNFFGTGPINAPIIIKVESEETFEDQILASTDGTWQWAPPKNLSPGQHTITITALGETIKRTFSILPSSDALAFTASASATITPSIVPTLVPTSEPVVTPTLIPTLAPSPTPTEIFRAAQPSTSSAVPISGNSLPIVVLISISLVLFLFSFTFFH